AVRKVSLGPSLGESSDQHVRNIGNATKSVSKRTNRTGRMVGTWLRALQRGYEGLNQRQAPGF
ncbi:MAG: hypothetical protein M1823_008400, partial [Watsoniomyces obsoletus]